MNNDGGLNTANGYQALRSNTSGNNNTASGASALYSNTWGANNNAYGYGSLFSNITGNSNTASGNAALSLNTTGSSNTALGYESLNNNTTGYFNVAVGDSALFSNTTGSNNTAIGYNANVAFDTLTNATAIGANSVVAESNAIVLGDTGANQVRVGIGTIAPLYRLQVMSNAENTSSYNSGIYVNAYNSTNVNIGVSGVVSGTATSTSKNYGLAGYATSNDGGTNYGVYGQSAGAQTINYGGYFTASGIYAFSGSYGTDYGLYATASPATTTYAGYFNGSVYTTGSYLPSDRKLKDNIEPLTSALEIIERLNPSTYIYNTEKYKYMNLPKGKRYGLIADEFQQVLPNLVTNAIQPAEYDRQDKNNPQKMSDAVEFSAVNYTELIPILIGAIKEQEKKIEDQQKEIEALKQKVK